MTDEIIFEDGELAELQQRMARSPALARQAREAILRQSYRPPCDTEDGARVVIDGRQFVVVNIGSHGLGIAVSDEKIFQAGMELPKIDFLLHGERFRLSGRVVHVSLAGEAEWLVGIDLVGLARQDEERIHELVRQRRRQIFKPDSDR